ncbi:FkbM family methyltransferase [Pseudomonadota bacterium]
MATHPICQRIRTLYVIGAFLFEERSLLNAVFPNLQVVYLFAPIPQAYRKLADTALGDSRLRVFPYAISDFDGEAEFHITNNFLSSSLLSLGRHKELYPEVNVTRTITVQVRTLRTVIHSHTLQSPDMLFLDVQGAEKKILESLNDAIRLRTQIVYTEVSTEELYKSSGTLNDIIDILDSDYAYLGYAPTHNEIQCHGNALFVNRFDMAFIDPRDAKTSQIASGPRYPDESQVIEEVRRLLEENKLSKAEAMLDAALDISITHEQLLPLAIKIKSRIYQDWLRRSEIVDLNYVDNNYRVTAIVSSYAAQEFMDECLSDLLAQTIADDLEILILDAASPENERDSVHEYQHRHSNIRYIRTPERIGIYLAWNILVFMAKGTFITPFSTNDRLRRNAFELLADSLASGDYAMVYGNSLGTNTPHESFYNNTASDYYRWPPYSFEMLLRRCLVGPNPMWKKSIHEKIGYFDQRYLAVGDQDFWCRIGMRYPILHIEEFTGLHWMAKDSLSGNLETSNAELAHIRQKYHRYYKARTGNQQV